MKKLQWFIGRRRELASRYDEALKDCPHLILPYQLPQTDSGYHLYIIQVTDCDRRQVFEELRAKGVGVNVHYIPVYYHPYYREHGYEDVCCPHAEQLYQRMISIPLHAGMTDAQQDYVIQCIKEIAGNL